MITWVLACALVPIVVCIAAGSATGSRLNWPGADMLVGFGLVSSALSMFAVTTRISLSWLMICLATLSMIAPLMRSPILVHAAGSEPAMWDDFWNWLPSAAYAYSHDSLVWPALAFVLQISGLPTGHASHDCGRLVHRWALSRNRRTNHECGAARRIKRGLGRGA
jgi:hypothetical protein